MQHLISISNEATRHITELTPDNPSNYISYLTLNIYGIPDDHDEDKVEACLDDESEAVLIGTVKGYMIYGAAMEKLGRDMYDECDAYSEYLENITTALLDGHLTPDSNHFFIEEIDIK